MNGDSKFGDFTNLDVWKMAHELRLKVRVLRSQLPSDEKYCVGNQIGRSAPSVCANIAEGHGRFHYQENIQYCRQARGSLDETRDHLIYIQDAKMLQNQENVEYLIDLCLKIKAKLNGYISYLKKCKHE